MQPLHRGLFLCADGEKPLRAWTSIRRDVRREPLEIPGNFAHLRIVYHGVL